MIKRHIEERLKAALADTPVVLVNGARQTGKSTLVKFFAGQLAKTTYITFDDSTLLASAVRDPNGFIRNIQGTAIIDEVQKVPELFPVIKMAVDNDRRPGRFLLTGSANVLMLPKLSESLAGRMEILTLRPFSQGEIEGHKETFLQTAFSGKSWSVAKSAALKRPALGTKLLQGGYPEMIRRVIPARRQAWFASYVTTILQRDVRDLAHIEGLKEAPRLLSLLAARSATMLNSAELSRSVGMPYTTLYRYLALLETTFLIYRVPAWSANLSKRLVKAPKILVGDTGLMGYLLKATEETLVEDPALAGRFLETFVGLELLKQIDWNGNGFSLFHYRTAAGREVDFVIEDARQRIVGIEVKSSSTVKADDFNGLSSLADNTGERFMAGILLYTGDHILPFGRKLWALPVPQLWRE